MAGASYKLPFVEEDDATVRKNNSLLTFFILILINDKQANGPIDLKWSTSPLDNCNTGGVVCALHRYSKGFFLLFS